jgi:biotin carboxyl carrier protein
MGIDERVGEMRYTITVEGETFEIDVGDEGRVWVNRRPYAVDFQGLDNRSEYSLLVDHRSYEAHIEQVEEDGCRMVVDGRPYQARLKCQGLGYSQDDAVCSDSASEGKVCAPLPGLLVAVLVTVGQRVMPGEVVAILESMKMNLELRTTRGGVVRSILAIPGMDVGQGEVVVYIGPEVYGQAAA